MLHVPEQSVGALVDSQPEDYSRAESEQGSDEEGSHPAEETVTSDDEINEELISGPGLQGLGFEAMLRSVLPSKKNLKKAGSREIKLWHTTRADA